jgi:hypothetical protein
MELENTVLSETSQLRKKNTTCPHLQMKAYKKLSSQK